jgi:RNA polymerase sigma-70 factor (ECF subfamily)
MNAPDEPVPTDEALVREAAGAPDSREGRAAAAELLRRYERRVFQWCLRYVRDRDTALDLTQEVLTKVWKSLASFGHRSRFSWWVFVITRNRCLNAVRAPSLLRDDEAELEGLPDAAPGPEEALERRLDQEAARRLMLETLDEQERLALWLCCYERMPVDAITRTLKLSNATGARGLLQRARRKLRAAIASRAPEGT